MAWQVVFSWPYKAEEVRAQLVAAEADHAKLTGEVRFKEASKKSFKF